MMENNELKENEPILSLEDIIVKFGEQFSP